MNAPWPKPPTPDEDAARDRLDDGVKGSPGTEAGIVRQVGFVAVLALVIALWCALVGALAYAAMHYGVPTR